MASPRLTIPFIYMSVMALFHNMVSAQDYPNRPVRINVSEVGGSGDFTARLIGPRIATGLGQPIIVENRASLLTIETVAKAAPDGYNVLITGTAFLTGPLLRKMSYDPVRDFAPISLLVIEPNVLIVHPSLPVKSVKELIALAKAHPGQLNYAYSSIGSSDHVAVELLKSMTGVSITGIAYKSNMQQTADVMSGEVQMTFQSGYKTAPLIKNGKLKALAVASLKPSALAPGLPTMESAGLPGFESVAMFSMYAPAKTPAAAITRLNQETVRVLNQPDIKQKFFETGVEVVGSSPEECAGKIKAEIARVSKVIKDAGISIK